MSNVLLDVVHIDLDLLLPLRVVYHFIGHLFSDFIDVFLEGADTGLSAVVLDNVVFHLIGNDERDITVQDA